MFNSLCIFGLLYKSQCLLINKLTVLTDARTQKTETDYRSHLKLLYFTGEETDRYVESMITKPVLTLFH
jgi:hypothetical protein